MSARSALRSLVLLLVAATIGPRAVAAEAAGNDKTPIQRAAAAESPPTGQVRSAGSAGTTMVLLGLLLAAAIVGRRIVQQRGGRRTGRSADKPIRLVARQQIDAELSVRLLQVGSRLLVVAATPQGIATLSEITDPEEISLLTGEKPETSAGGTLFTGGTPVATTAAPTTQTHREPALPVADRRIAPRFRPAVEAGG
jgi:flagellar biogenesis protein FliO